MDGVINIFKEKGYTSHDVVAKVRRLLGRPKTGHTGTLDPAAQGVLPICVGRATRISAYLTDHTKAYRAEILFGLETDTQDATGATLATHPVDFDEEKIRLAIHSFSGSYEQQPPMYSAIKIGGEKLYKLARQGVTVERPKRLVEIHNIEVLSLDANENKAVIEVDCSKGTYIRSLCADIGERLGCGACMGELLRTRSGRFRVEDSVTLEALAQALEEGQWEKFLIPIDEAVDLRKIMVAEEATKALYNGNALDNQLLSGAGSIGESLLVYDWEENLVGLYLQQEGRIKPSAILYTERRADARGTI